MHRCEQMNRQVEHSCPTCHGESPCPDRLVSFDDVFNEYGLVVHDGGTSSVEILFCPWCGSQLPLSQRNEWFEQLELLGFDSPLNQDIPARFRSSEWRLRVK
nr:putative integron gene cassette protein [uncultured bacterium]